MVARLPTTWTFVDGGPSTSTMSDGRRSPFISKTVLSITLSICLNLVSQARAQEQRISQMIHTSWAGRDGAPQGITALAQTRDGILWIAGFGGLFRFDGVAFEPFRPRPESPPLPGSAIRFLFVSNTGDVWLFPFYGPPARVHDGGVQTYARVDGEPIEVLGHAQQGPDGTLWAVLNERHLIRLGSEDVWHQVSDPIPETGHISELFIDSGDTQWVIENNVLYRRPHGQTAFVASDTRVFGMAKIVESRDHTLWVLGQGPGRASTRRLEHVDQTGHALFAPGVDGALSDLLIAADDSLWISKNDGSLQRLAHAEIAPHASESLSPNPPDIYTVRRGITGFGQPLLKDADDNIWVGGMGGLERFEHADIVPVMSDAKVGVWFTCVDTQGQEWVGNSRGQLFAVRNGRARQIDGEDGASNLFCGADGRVYFLHESRISVIRDGRAHQLPLLPGVKEHRDNSLFLGIIDQPNGHLIASVGGAAGRGLWSYAAGHWSPFLSDLALPEVSAMVNVPGSGLYLTFSGDADRVGRVRTNAPEMLSVPIRPVGLTRTSYGVVAYGLKGIAFERDDRFHVLSLQHPEDAALVTGLVESGNGDLWLSGARGIVRLPAADLRAAMADWSFSVSSMNLREGDFVGPDVIFPFRQSAHVDPTGRLWFSTLSGIVSVDPNHLDRPRKAPQLSIRAISADGKPLNPTATLSPDTQYVNVRYFGLDLSHPRDVVYRYRLVGLDSRWVDAGPRTDTIYTHLRPGQYIFEVMASSGNDVWTMPVSSVTLTVLPHLYQRAWFEVLFLLLGASIAWGAGYQRVRNMRTAMRIRAEERAEERIRIARDLHDTLLQGVQGLLLSFHVAAEKVPPDHESRRALERALAMADRFILEGRNRVTRLRSEHLSDAELLPAIECLANDLNGGDEVPFAVHRHGDGASLDLHIVDEVFSITREAVTNAFRHAEATRIEVELDYQPHEFRMTCRDNGHGFDVDAMLAATPNGHWGLRGMVERAEKIGASFRCQIAAGAGTEVRVIVPARRAYVRPKRLRRWWRRNSAA